MEIVDNINIIKSSRNFIVLYENDKWVYDLETGSITDFYSLEKLLEDKDYLETVINKGFNNYEKGFDSNEDFEYKSFYIPISRNFLEFYKQNWEEEEYLDNEICLCNINLTQETVQSFYEFSLGVEVEGLRIFYSVSSFDNETIECYFPRDDDEMEKKLISLFGEPQVHPANEGDKYGRLSKNYFFFPKSKIDKIIGIKKYRDIATIGQSDGEFFTGEEEEFILDMHNFDESIYKIFEEHGFLTLEN